LLAPIKSGGTQDGLCSRAVERVVEPAVRSMSFACGAWLVTSNPVGGPTSTHTQCRQQRGGMALAPVRSVLAGGVGAPAPMPSEGVVGTLGFTQPPIGNAGSPKRGTPRGGSGIVQVERPLSPKAAISTPPHAGHEHARGGTRTERGEGPRSGRSAGRPTPKAIARLRRVDLIIRCYSL
jgi:hypothetical protein